MAWFRNHYKCAESGCKWTDEWSCMCDDDCPQCGARHMSPFDSDDLTEIIEECRGKFVVLRSPGTAEHVPEYKEIGRFSTVEEAETFLNSQGELWEMIP